MNKVWKWGYTEKEYDYEIEDGAVWIENKYFSFYTGHQLPFGKYDLEWDGVPFWIISFGLFSISFGRIGRWVMLKNSLSYKSEKA